MTVSNALIKNRIADVMALTPMQSGILFHYLKHPDSRHYFEQLCLEVKGDLTSSLFEKAWDMVVSGNEMLRTVFRWEKLEHPSQILLKSHSFTPTYIDLSDIALPAMESHIEQVKAKDIHSGFDLRKVPFRITLCKLKEKSFLMIISHHHILYDGWSTGIILAEFFKFYDRLSRGEPLLLPESHKKTSFKEYIRWNRERDAKTQGTFWRKYMEDFEDQSIKTGEPGDAGADTSGNFFQTSFNATLEEQILTFVKTCKITLASLFYSAWGLCLQRYCNSEDVMFGTTISGRTTSIKGIENIVGLFINTVPLRIKNVPGETCKQLLLRIHRDLRVRAEFEHTSLVDIKKYSGITSNKTEIFDSIMVIENYPLEKALAGASRGLACRFHSMHASVPYDLAIAVTVFQGISVSFHFNPTLFDGPTIANMAGHFSRLLEKITGNDGIEAIKLEITGEEEKKLLLETFNDTSHDFPQEKTIYQLFAGQVQKTPHHIALKCRSGSGPGHVISLTYTELNRQTMQLARALKEKGVREDTLTALILEDPLDMATAIFAVLYAGGAYLPIDPTYPEERIDYMLKDSRAALVLKNLDGLNNLAGETGSWRQAEWCDSSSGRLCYVIYTSGSTGRPKAVAVEHRGVANTLVCRKQIYRLDHNTIHLQLFSFSFDGFVAAFFTPLISGARVIFPGSRQINDIPGVCREIVKEGVTHFIAVPQLFQAILEILSGGETASLRAVTLAGDRLSPQLPDKTRLYDENIEIVHEYGVTEASVMSTLFRHQERSARISIGKPTWNTRIYILGIRQTLQPVGVAGELCIGGVGLARGYLNRPELTAEKFSNPSPFTVHCSPIYKTGDQARWLTDGNIEFLGRLDNQVKIRGFRIETGEIEKCLLAQSPVKDAAVILRKDEKDDPFLCAYLVAKQDLHIPLLKEALLRELPGHMLPAAFMVLKEMPLNRNGKVDKKALPDPVYRGGKSYVPPGNDLEKKLVEIWSKILFGGEDGATGKPIGLHDNFFEIGGHSLSATILLARIQKEFEVKLEMVDLFKRKTLKELAETIESAQTNGQEIAAGNEIKSIEPVEQREYYPLSSMQNQFYIQQHMAPQSTAYNIAQAVRLEEKPSTETLEQVIAGLVKRHESLRTSFREIDGTTVQFIHPPEAINIIIEHHEIPGKDVKSLLERFIRPFDLVHSPLFRSGLVTVHHGDETQYIVLFDMHHIISDGMSMEILANDFNALLEGGELPTPALQYKDFSHWQHRRLKKGAMDLQRDFWLAQFNGYIPDMNLPTDFPRRSAKGFTGESVSLDISSGMTGKLRLLASREISTLYMVMFSAYNVLLSKLCAQQDIIVGTALAGRKQAGLMKVFGLFFNTLALRNYPHHHKRFRDFLDEIKLNTLNAFENQDYGFDALVRELVSRKQLIRDPRRNPLFDTMFAFRNYKNHTDLPDNRRNVAMDSPPHFYFENKSAKFDLLLNVTEDKDKIRLTLDYSTALFRPSTARDILIYYLDVLNQVVENSDVRLGDISISSRSSDVVCNLNVTEYRDFKF